MKKILVPVDGSDSSKKAAEEAVILARTCGGTLTFLSVVEIKYDFAYSEYGDITGSDYFAVKDSLIKMDADRENKMLGEFVDALHCADIQTEKKVLLGDPHPLIVQIAEEGGFDLIVMGHRGLNPLQRLFIGSVAKRVIEDAPCSVYVVK